MRKSDNVNITIEEPRLRAYIRKYLVNEAIGQDIDHEYLAAVRAGDIEKATALFNQAARSAGFITKVYHNTDADFTVFDTDECSTTRKGHAWMADYIDGTIFLGNHPGRWYGKRTMRLLVNPGDFKRFNIENGHAVDAMDNQGYAYQVVNYPGIRLVDRFGNEIFATLDPTLIKSAEPVVYDNHGEVVPLSQRFSKSDDIRYEEE